MDRVSERFYTIWDTQGDKQQYGLYGADRDTAIPISRPGVLRMSEGLAAVDTGDGIGFVNRLGDMRIEPRFSAAYSFQEGFAAVKTSEAQGGRWGFLQKNDRLAFVDRRGEIERLRSFSDGMAALQAGGQWGFLNKRYKVRIKPSYDEVRDFFNGRAAVRQGDEWGYIDKRGRKLAWGFQKAWDYPADEDHTSLALVKKNQAYTFIDAGGKARIDPGPGSVLPFVRETARVECGGSFGYIDSSGRLIYDPRQYEEYGIRGWDAGEIRPPVWTGLWNSDGKLDAPFPLEADVADSLPFNQTHRP